MFDDISGISFMFSKKTYIVGTHSKHLGEALLMSTHNICIYGEIRNIIPELSLNAL